MSDTPNTPPPAPEPVPEPDILAQPPKVAFAEQKERAAAILDELQGLIAEIVGREKIVGIGLTILIDPLHQETHFFRQQFETSQPGAQILNAAHALSFASVGAQEFGRSAAKLTAKTHEIIAQSVPAGAKEKMRF